MNKNDKEIEESVKQMYELMAIRQKWWDENVGKTIYCLNRWNNEIEEIFCKDDSHKEDLMFNEWMNLFIFERNKEDLIKKK